MRRLVLFNQIGRFSLTRITVKFTVREIELLSGLASDQLFHREFIDSRLPGTRSNPAELSLGKELVVRLQSCADRAVRAQSAKNGAAALKKSRKTAARVGGA